MIHVDPWSDAVTERDVGSFAKAGRCFGCDAPLGADHVVNAGRECWRLRRRLSGRLSWIAYMHVRTRREDLTHAQAAEAMDERDRLADELRAVGRYEREALRPHLARHWKDHRAIMALEASIQPEQEDTEQ